MDTIHLDKPSVDLARAFAIAHPGYKGRSWRVRIVPAGDEISWPNSYWDGGSKTSAAVVRLVDGAVEHVPDNHPMFDKGPRGEFVLPQGFIMVEHSIFCGKDTGLTAIVRSDDVNPGLLPAPVEGLTWGERVVLYACCSLKSSYGGIPQYRMMQARERTGIRADEYEAAKMSLIGRGLLTKAGAVTAAGRNVRTGGQNRYEWPQKEQGE